MLNEELKHNIKDAIRENVTIVTPPDDVISAVDSLSDEQLEALKAHIAAREATKRRRHRQNPMNRHPVHRHPVIRHPTRRPRTEGRQHMTEKEQQPVTPEIPTEAADKPESDNPPKTSAAAVKIRRSGSGQSPRIASACAKLWTWCASMTSCTASRRKNSAPSSRILARRSSSWGKSSPCGRIFCRGTTARR